MSKSQWPSLSDTRRVFRLIGELHDLGHDSQLWHERLVQGVRGLLAGRTAIAGEWRWRRPGFAPLVRQIAHSGFDETMAQRFRLYGRTRAYMADPCFQAISQSGQGLEVSVFLRRELVEDSIWYHSHVFNAYYKPSGVDHALISLRPLSADGRVDVLIARRALGERPFSRRDKRLARLLHHEVGRLIGPTLATIEEPGIHHLPPRQQQALNGLARGLSEKQLAALMGISLGTLHQYVTQLFKYFEVSGRAELMAKYLGRNRLPPPP